MRVPLVRDLTLAALLAAALPLAPTAGAQQVDPGDRLRVTAGAGRTVGLLQPSPADSLVLTTELGRAAFATARVERVERSLGRRGRAGRGALIGAGVMATLGVVALVTEGGDDGAGEDWGGVIVAASLPAYLAVGAGVGALVGVAWRTERWGEVEVGARIPR